MLLSPLASTCYPAQSSASASETIPEPKAVRPSPGADQFIQLALGPVPLVAVPGLQPPDELIPPAGGLVQVVVGQVAPLLLDLPLELLPIALDLIPVHDLPPSPTTGTAEMVTSDDASAVCRPGAGCSEDDYRSSARHGDRRVASSILRPAASAGPLGGLTVSRTARAALSTRSPARSAGPSWQPTSGSSPPSTRGRTCKREALLLRIPDIPLGRIRMAGAGRQPRSPLRTIELISKSDAQVMCGDCPLAVRREVGHRLVDKPILAGSVRPLDRYVRRDFRAFQPRSVPC